MDDLPAVFAATNFVFEQSGKAPMTLDKFRAEFCLPFTKFYDEFTPHVPLQQLEDWFHQHFRGGQDSVRELPHARQFLEFCRQNKLRLFVLSTIHEEYYRQHVAVNGFGDFMERAYLAIRDKRAKIGEVLAENGLKARETLFIGDMQHDIDTARHGGVLSCGVLTGYNSVQQLRASQPDLIVEHLGELRAILQKNRFELTPQNQAVDGAFAPQPVCTVGGLIYNNRGEVLMIRTQKWSNLWGIPGGKTKFGETSVQALAREIKEETNLAVDNIEFVMVQDCIHSNEFYRDAHFILLNYRCHVQGGDDVKLNDEAQEFRWMPFSAAMHMELNRPTRVLLEQVHGSNHH